MQKKCFECGSVATENHHVIPRSLGGTKTVPLCIKCHCLIHNLNSKRRDQHSDLTKRGLELAKAKGRIGGSKKGCDTTKAVAAALIVRRANADSRNKNAVSMAKTLRSGGMIYKRIANEMQKAGFLSPRGLNITINAVKRWVNA